MEVRLGGNSVPLAGDNSADMSSVAVWTAQHLLGWQRYKLGWLDAAHILCVDRGRTQLVLSELAAGPGTKMIVIPVGQDESPSQVYVAEVAQPTGTGSGWKDQGVLVYSVDATVPTFQEPIRVVHTRSRKSDPQSAEAQNYGAIYNAPFKPGDDPFEAAVRPGVWARIRVLRRIGSCFEVRVVVDR